MRAQDKGARIFGPPTLLGCFGAGACGPGSLGPGLAPVVATASFPLINLPKFYLSFTILVSLILVKYPDRVGLVNAMIWPRILVFTSMMLRVLTPAAFGSYGAGIYIPKLGLVPKHVRPVRPVANLYDLLTS